MRRMPSNSCLTPLANDAAAARAAIRRGEWTQHTSGLADRHVILEKGRVVWAGSSPELEARQDLWADYLSV